MSTLIDSAALATLIFKTKHFLVVKMMKGVLSQERANKLAEAMYNLRSGAERYGSTVKRRVCARRANTYAMKKVK